MKNIRVKTTFIMISVFLTSAFVFAQEPISFELIGNELLRECPRTDCVIIQYGTIDSTATIKEINGVWYKVEVEERATIQTLNDPPYVKAIKLIKPVFTEGYYHQSLVPEEIRANAEQFFAEKNSQAIQENTEEQPDVSVLATTEQRSLFNISLNYLLVVFLLIGIFIVVFLARRNEIVRSFARKIIAPKFIATILALLVVGFGAYFGISEYRKQQLAHKSSLQTQQEALEKSQQEIEALKKSDEEQRTEEQNKLKQLQDQIKSLQNQSKQTPPVIVSPPQLSNSTTLIKKFAPAIVKLTCSVSRYSNDASQGSGTLFFDPEDGTYTIFTNYHVIETEDGSAPFCVVTVYPNSPSLAGALAYKSQAGSFKYFGGLDISAFNIEPIDDYIGQSLFNQPVSKPLSYLRQYALDGKATLLCGEPQIGEKVFVLGYPSVGGDSITVTDGIVAGIENDGNTKYYKTSAKIEHGNSGGAAILENACFLGIPTLAIRGSIESLAYILPLQ